MKPDFPRHCVDCDMNLFLEWFTLHDHVWRRTGLESNGGCLCIGCVERRISRRLLPEDFQSTENNQNYRFMGERFLDRVGVGLVWYHEDGREVPREEAQPWIGDCENPPP